MNKISKKRKIFMIIFIFVFVPFIKIDAAGLELYTEHQCYYSNPDASGDKGLATVTMTRKITGNIIRSTYSSYNPSGKKVHNNQVVNSDTHGFTTSTESDKAYNQSTSCPKSIRIYNPAQLRASSDINEYELKLTKEEKKGENIYKKVATCLYQTYSDDTLDLSQYRLKFIPSFYDNKLNSGEAIVTYLFSAEVYKPTLSDDGNYVWTPQDISDLKISTETIISTKCMNEAYYNPKLSNINVFDIHEFSFGGKPKSWSAKETYILNQYFDFTDQIAGLDKLFNQFKTKIDSGFIEKCLNKNYPYSDACIYKTLKANCITFESIKTYNDLLIKSFNETLAEMEKINLGNGLTLADDLNSSYKQIKEKYLEIIKKMNDIFSQKNSLIDCLLEKMLNDPNLSEEKKEEINSFSDDSKREREKIIELLKTKEYKFDVDTSNVDCKNLLGDILDWIKDAFFFIQIGAVILTIVLTMLDFTKAVSASDDDTMKKAQKNFIKRVLILAAILILPALIQFVLGLIDIPGLNNTSPFCE